MGILWLRESPWTDSLHPLLTPRHWIIMAPIPTLPQPSSRWGWTWAACRISSRQSKLPASFPVEPHLCIVCICWYKVNEPDATFQLHLRTLPREGLDLRLCDTTQCNPPWLSCVQAHHGVNWRTVVWAAVKHLLFLSAHQLLSGWHRLLWTDPHPEKECSYISSAADIVTISFLVATRWMYIQAFKE